MPSEVTAIASAARMACGSRAAVFNMGARLCGAALGFVLAVALARSMEPAGFAQVSAVFAWLAVATVLGCLGMPLVAVRFIGENLAVGRHDLARGVVVFALGASAGASALLVGIAWGVLHAGWFPLTPQSLRVADLGLALVLPNVLLTVVAGVLQALNHAVLAEVLSSVLRSLMMIIGLAWIWSRDAQEKLAPVSALWLYWWVAVLLLGVAWALMLRLQRMESRESRLTRYEMRTWMHSGIGVLAVLIAAAISERLDMMMLAWRGASDEVAAYAVAQRFSQTLLMAVNAMAAVLAPRFVACLPSLRAGDAAGAQEAVRANVRLTVRVCVVAALAFALLGNWLTQLFGPGYTAAYLPLMILLGGQVAACLFGPALLVATLSGNVRITLTSLGLGLGVNAALNWISVPAWGATGAAFASAIGAVLAAGMAQAFTRSRLGIVTSLFGQPRLAGAGSAP